MALLSIAEPGQSQAPHQHRLAVGIDLGTTNSLVAAVRDGTAVALRDEDGLKLLPSVVRYRPDGPVEVGLEARSQQLADPLNTIVSVKRWMGRRLADLTDAQRRAYHLHDGHGMVEVETAAGTRSPVQISADILKVLRQRAEQALAGELVGAVIAVPAYFDDAQRQATKDAARLAGLNVLRLLNEPDGRRHRLRTRACERRPLCGVRPGGWNLRYLYPAADPRRIRSTGRERRFRARGR